MKTQWTTWDVANNGRKTPSFDTKEQAIVYAEKEKKSGSEVYVLEEQRQVRFKGETYL